MNFVACIKSQASLSQIADYLNSLGHRQRLAEIHQVDGPMQALLYEMAEGAACKLVGDFVPRDKLDQQVVHWGVNSLPVASRFQKMFYMSSNQPTFDVCPGYNEHRFRILTGPGYFTAKDHLWQDTVSRVTIDYFDVPTQKLPQWPTILPQNVRLARFMYYQTRDWMWKVSDHISVGRAKKLDDWLDSWFVLCREP